MPFITVGDLSVCYERQGDGAPLLFISGTGSDLRVRPGVMDGPLPKQFDVLAYDQRGLGQTSKPDIPYTMADYADEPGHAMGAQRQLDARAAHDTWDRLPQIACPTLIAAGRYDGLALPQTQARMAAQIPGARLQVFDGGHMFIIQDREAFPAIVDFLNQT